MACGHPRSEPDEIDATRAVFRESFMIRLPGALAALSRLHAQGGRSAETARRLHDAIHPLIGSARMLGATETGCIMQRLDSRLFAATTEHRAMHAAEDAAFAAALTEAQDAAAEGLAAEREAG